MTASELAREHAHESLGSIMASEAILAQELGASSECREAEMLPDGRAPRALKVSRSFCVLFNETRNMGAEEPRECHGEFRLGAPCRRDRLAFDISST